jgi:hypothetical protein
LPYEFREIAEAINQNSKMGVSLAGDYIVYGKLKRTSNIALTIRLVDKFLGHIVFGEQHEDEFSNYKFKDNYKPLKYNDVRLSGMCVYFDFRDYQFSKKEMSLVITNSEMVITLVPTKKGEQSEDGGALPDFNAIEKGFIPEAYKKNAEHISNNIDYYNKELMMRMVNCYGEAAAFSRALKRNGINLKELAETIK